MLAGFLSPMSTLHYPTAVSLVLFLSFLLKQVQAIGPKEWQHGDRLSPCGL